MNNVDYGDDGVSCWWWIMSRIVNHVDGGWMLWTKIILKWRIDKFDDDYDDDDNNDDEDDNK